jgi:putative transcriptional regulator
MGIRVENKVHELRFEIGMTQEELAEKAGVTRQTVISIEKGNYTPSVLLSLKIAKIFGKVLEEVFYIKND